ncbi:hypothetical protein [Endozoicomonas elysicola]|uniref:Uncharacterized protein n=1 Tax=Endozoicomonas elysicola TaxID=305900 RepID=A0A081K943_9GAMM|nr:hypothetical protein [Endozoicomonas elysicola]KEI70669.1 hypothetical protein GV64_07885 [Endozoicomonas elysicola]
MYMDVLYPENAGAIFRECSEAHCILKMHDCMDAGDRVTQEQLPGAIFRECTVHQNEGSVRMRSSILSKYSVMDDDFMDEHTKSTEARMKVFVDEGCSLAEAFLKTFADEDLQEQQVVMNRILGKLSIQGLQSGSDYYFVDGSRLNIDPAVDSMLATKSSSTDIRPRPSA